MKHCDICRVGVGVSRQYRPIFKKDKDQFGWLWIHHKEKQLYNWSKPYHKEWLEEVEENGKYRYYRASKTFHPKKVCSECLKKLLGLGEGDVIPTSY